MQCQPLIQTSTKWVASAGINDKKYNPWIGSKLLGVRDQFLIFHPLVLLWDLKRIQLFLNKIQSYSNYSFLLIDSRPEIKMAIKSYLNTNNIPRELCHVLNFDFPGTLTNQYYISTQSTASSIVTSKQILVFFDYYLNRQFYNESTVLPCVRLSLYSLHNLPTNMQYGLPAKSGVLLAIKLLLKLLLKPLARTESQLNTSNYALLIKNTNTLLPSYKKKNVIDPSIHGKNRLLGFQLQRNVFPGWRQSMALRNLNKQLTGLKKNLSKRLKTRKTATVSKWKRFNLKNNTHLISVKKSPIYFTLIKKQSLKVLFNGDSYSNVQPTLGIKFEAFKNYRRTKITQSILKRVLKTIKRRKLRIFNPSLPSSTSIINQYNGQPFLKQKRKVLLAKYTRTCNIKTQKEWQQIKQKNKLRIEKIKQKQRAAQRATLKIRGLHAKTRNQKSQFKAKASTLTGFRKEPGRSNRIAPTFNKVPLAKKLNGRRSFSVFLQQTTKIKKPLVFWPNYFYGRFSMKYWKDKFRQVSFHSRRFRFKWNYFRVPSQDILSKSVLLSLTRGLKKSSFKNFNLYQNKVKTRENGLGLALLKVLYTNSKKKHRIKKFAKWRKVMFRKTRKADRRWRPRKWKKAAIRQLSRSLQRVYHSDTLVQGRAYWRKLRMYPFIRPVNWRKWRSRYFRRFSRKDQFYLQFKYKPQVIFCNSLSKTFPKTEIGTQKSKQLYPSQVITSFSRYLPLRSSAIKKNNTQVRLSRRVTKSYFNTKRILLRKARKKLSPSASKKAVQNKRNLAFLGKLPKNEQLKYLLTSLNASHFLTLASSKNYTNQLWFRTYRNHNGIRSAAVKSSSNKFRQDVRQKMTYIKKNKLFVSYWSSCKLKALIKFKNQQLWNWRQFRDRQRTVEEFKRFVQNYQHTHIKLHKHHAVKLVASEKLRRRLVQKFIKNAIASSLKTSNNISAGTLKILESKPIKIKKVDFLKFNGRLLPNQNILFGTKASGSMLPLTFLQCYRNRRFWANDNFGPSPLVFWISPKARRAETPKQWHLTTSALFYNVQIKLPNFSCLAFQSRKKGTHLQQAPMLSKSVASKVPTVYKEITSSSGYNQTFKFVINNQTAKEQKKQRWVWYYLAQKYAHPSIKWQQLLTSSKSSKFALQRYKHHKVFSNHYYTPKSVRNYIQYLLRCNRRRRRRLRERTFKGPTRYRRKYRTHYMFNYLVRLNSHRSRYGKPNLSNKVKHYFIRKLVLRRFLRCIYGQKLTNRYFKHFSNLLFIKKFKFWTLYTFFYLRLDFVAIMLKFALNLTWARYLITQGNVLVNNKPAKISYSIFLGDIIRLKKKYLSETPFVSTEVDLLRNISAYAPRVGTSPIYQRRLRVPPFFEYNGRIRAGTMFRLPWYFEVKGKLMNKENLLLLARGHQSF